MNLSINPTDKILIITAYPEDLAVACGGFISKYNKQIDILCINRALNDAIYDEFIEITDKADVNKVYIQQPTEAFNKDFISSVDISPYSIILIPNKEDNNSERQYISNELLKELLEKQSHKSNLQILRYENWNPIKEANYYENITDVIDKKREIILSYKKTEGMNFADRVLNLNKFRTFTSNLNGLATHVEAYFIDNLSAYLCKPDIINEITDKDFSNNEIEIFLNEQKAQDKINDLKKRLQNKKIIIFCAGEFSRCLFKNYDLSGLNIIAIADRRFEEERIHEFYGIKCIKPQDIKNTDCDMILISAYDFVKFYDILTNTIIKDCDIEIAPIIQTNLSDIMQGNCSNKICTHPFHIISIVPTGHCITCCPAYIKNFTIGNVFKNDFGNIWNGKRAKYLRNALKNGDYTTCDLKTCIYMELKDKKELYKYYETNSEDIKMPDTIFMGWDYDCNVACITCRNEIIKNDENKLRELQAIEQSVLDACKNAKLFYTSGNGDPFGSSYARNLIKKVVEINPQIKFLIHTNGVLCNENICNELNITDKIKGVTFSIHASCKETYDKIVRYGNFDKVIENLKWVSTLKKDGKIETITLVFVVHKLNYRDMKDFVKLAEEFGAIASFRHYRQWTNNTEYKYDDMAVFDKSHPEYCEFVKILQDKIFGSPHCLLEPGLKLLRD